ncbi:beta-galactosidase [Lactiplantibacillus garii]|uniref:Beta-galactosidase n=1 Tax=Lactiplantibacillus garii TaxID=2306423 RepID=A0A426D6P4_9LACO|nr:beta-galactosidase [Lactiplantibacillus garii]RRK10272.1 beta-galactosidase [Lactiplantibacillus garii]
MFKPTQFLHGGDYNPDQWLDQPSVIDQDFKAFENAHLNTVTLGVFAWDRLEPAEGQYNFDWLDEMFDRAAAQKMNVILATPSGARPRWLAEKYPEVLRVGANGLRNRFGERHNHCYTSPVYREKVRQINQKLAERYGYRKNLIMWHVSNEYGGACYCDLCQAAFRQWLRAKYQTLDRLNHAYWGAFWSHEYTDWSQVEAPMTQGDQNVTGLNLDWRRFVTDQTINFFDAEVAPLRAVNPAIPVTTNFMGGNPPESHVFYDLDYQKFAQHVDVVSWDSYPNWGNDYESTAELALKTSLMNDTMRSLKHQNYLIMENTPSMVNWHPVNHAKRPGMHVMASLQEVAHGADSVMYFQLHQSRGASEMFHSAVISNRGGSHTRTFQDVTRVGQILQRLKGLQTTQHQAAKVAIVFDYDNMWALDDARAYANATKCYWATIQAHYRYFWEHDIAVELVSVHDDLTPYTLVIDPMHFLMAPAFATKLKTYVQNGGHLVGTYVSGVVDQNFLAYQGAGMADLITTYGLKVTETDTLYPSQRNAVNVFNRQYQVQDYCDLVTLTTAKTLGTYGKDFYAGTPAVTENELGTGRAYYLACRTDADFLQSFYHRLVQKLQLQAKLPIKKSTKNVAIQVRESTTQRVYFVINYSHEPTQVTLTTPLNNALDGQTVRGMQTLSGYGVLIYSEAK